MIYHLELRVMFFMYVILSASCIEVSLTSNMTKLLYNLLENYAVDARPMDEDPEKGTRIQTEFYPMHITELNEKTGILTLEAFINMVWEDERLRWSPEDYGGIREARISEDRLWKPDLVPHQRRGRQNLQGIPVQLMVSSSGVVKWISIVTLELICEAMDYQNFPWDTQKCLITLSSWTNNKNCIDLVIDEDSYAYYETREPKNPTWRIKNTSVVRDEMLYPEFDTVPFVDLKFTMELERCNSPISFLSSYPAWVARLLILCAFWTPEATRKFVFLCTSLLVLTIAGSTIVQEVPSPAVTSVALSNVKSGMYLCVAAIFVELILTVIPKCGFRPPIFLDYFADSTFCCLLFPCYKQEDAHVPLDRSKDDSMRDIKMRNNWMLLANILTFVAFLVFLLLICIL